MIRQSIFLADLILSIVALVIHFESAPTPEVEETSSSQLHHKDATIESHADRARPELPKIVSQKSDCEHSSIDQLPIFHPAPVQQFAPPLQNSLP